jgi:hypothetical protein
MSEKTIKSLDAISQFLLWVAGSAIPFRLLALSVPAAKINLWYLAIALFLSFFAIVATTIRWDGDSWRISDAAGHLWNRLALVAFGFFLGVWGLWL